MANEQFVGQRYTFHENATSYLTIGPEGSIIVIVDNHEVLRFTKTGILMNTNSGLNVESGGLSVGGSLQVENLAVDGLITGNDILVDGQPYGLWIGQVSQSSGTFGADTTPANGTTFIGSIHIPQRMTISRVSYLVGTVGGTDRVYAAIWNGAGQFIASSSLVDGGTIVGSSATRQFLDLTAPVVVPTGQYFIGIAMNGNTARLRTIQAFGDLSPAGTVSMTHGTLTDITPITTFTANSSPVGTIG